jgi:fructuronate reductase
VNVRLSAQTLDRLPADVRRPQYDLTRVHPGILHFGPGAFHRVHQAWYADQLLHADQRWGITGVSLHSAGVRDALAPQDGLYSLSVQDDVPAVEIVGSIRAVLVASENPAAVIERFADPRLHVVTLTVTEKGYCLATDGSLDATHQDVQRDLSQPGSPASVLGYLVAGLRRRRSLGLAAPAVISCDNVADNGRRLHGALVALARMQDESLGRWIEDEVRSPCTMVDSICPATTDALRTEVAARLGLHDAWPVQRESFTQWVMEDLAPPGGPDWASVGVTVTTDVAAFERAKLRILNCAHSTLAYLGLRAGCTSVAQAMQQRDLVACVRRMLVTEVLPVLRPAPGQDLTAYVETVLRRFGNRRIVHELAQIAWDGSQKLRFRVLGTVRDALALGRPIDDLCIPLAAWMWFVRWKVEQASPIVDPLAGRLAQFGDAWCFDASRDVERFLSLHEVFGEDLPASARFRAALERAYARVAAWPAQPLSA